MNFLNRFSNVFPSRCLKRKSTMHQAGQISANHGNGQLENNKKLSAFIQKGKNCCNDKLTKAYDYTYKFCSNQYDKYASKEDQRIHGEMIANMKNYVQNLENAPIKRATPIAAAIFISYLFPLHVAGAVALTIAMRNIEGFIFGKNEKDIENKLKAELKPEVKAEIENEVTLNKKQEIKNQAREELIKEEAKNIQKDSQSAVANQLIYGMVKNNPILTKDEKEYLAELVNPENTKPINTMEEWSDNLKHLNYINSYIEGKKKISNEIDNSNFSDELKIDLKNELSSCKGDSEKQSEFLLSLREQTESLDRYINLINNLDFINDNEKEHFITVTKNNLKDNHKDIFLEAQKHSKYKNKIDMEVKELLESNYINEDRKSHFIQAFEKEYGSCEFNLQLNSLINIKNNIKNEIEFQEKLEDATSKRLPPSEMKKIYEDYEKKNK